MALQMQSRERKLLTLPSSDTLSNSLRDRLSGNFGITLGNVMSDPSKENSFLIPYPTREACREAGYIIVDGKAQKEDIRFPFYNGGESVIATVSRHDEKEHFSITVHYLPEIFKKSKRFGITWKQGWYADSSIRMFDEALEETCRAIGLSHQSVHDGHNKRADPTLLNRAFSIEMNPLLGFKRIEGTRGVIYLLLQDGNYTDSMALLERNGLRPLTETEAINFIMHDKFIGPHLSGAPVHSDCYWLADEEQINVGSYPAFPNMRTGNNEGIVLKLQHGTNPPLLKPTSFASYEQFSRITVYVDLSRRDNPDTIANMIVGIRKRA